MPGSWCFMEYDEHGRLVMQIDEIVDDNTLEMPGDVASDCSKNAALILSNESAEKTHYPDGTLKTLAFWRAVPVVRRTKRVYEDILGDSEDELPLDG